MSSPLAQLIAELQNDRVLAHAVLFPKRHTNKTPAFHKTILEAWASPVPRLLIEAFRGSAKSTLAEEALIVGALFCEFKYALIVGNSASAACQRLAAVKWELENNEKIESMFGSMVGGTWNQDEIVLANNVRIKALGRGQSPRGAKDDSSGSRPDLLLIDDLEDPDVVKTKEMRDATQNYLLRDLIPALDDPLMSRVRVNGTPLHEDSMIERLAKSDKWTTLKFPIYSPRPDGTLKPVWPDRFPLAKCMEMQAEAVNNGDLAGFSQEYLCAPIDNQSRTFQADMIRMAMPHEVPSWAPKILMVDPARTTGQKSSRTGYVVFSWIGNRLWVYEAVGGFHTPSEQVEKIFALNAEFKPMMVAVEANGLEQWLSEPLQAEMIRRGEVLPLEMVRAPNDKDGFIAGLEPFFRAKEVMFVKDLPDLRSEMLSFPFGKKDVVNALAYALKLRAGIPVYPMFGAEHVMHRTLGGRARYTLALNADSGTLVGIFIAVQDGSVHVISDWVQQGPMQDGFRRIGVDLAMQGFHHWDITIPEERAQTSDMVPLASTLRQASRRYVTGKRLSQAVESLVPLLRGRDSSGGPPWLTVAPEATWVLNALAGGYHRTVEHNRTIRPDPVGGVYCLMAQALESAVGGWGNSLTQNTLEDVHYAHTRSGRAYLSLRR